jgi:integrase
MLPLSDEERGRFLDVVCGHRLEALFTAAVLLGLRCDELLSLKWADVDFSNGTLTLPTRLPSAKSELPAFLHVPALCLARLQENRASQERLRQEAGSRWQETGLVFTSSTGTVLPEGKVLREFHKLLTRAGIANSPLVATHLKTAGVEQ